MPFRPSIKAYCHGFRRPQLPYKSLAGQRPTLAFEVREGKRASPVVFQSVDKQASNSVLPKYSA